MKTAIYARYSTELQSDRSVEDQFALCEAYAAREGLEIVARFEDRARTGGTVTGRPGLSQLMQLVIGGGAEVVLVEALDRLSRDMEDLSGIYKRLSFAGVAIRAVHEGQINTVLVGLRGLIGQLYREDNAHKVRRGLRGRANDGMALGRPPYGYRPIAGQPGARAIVPEQAAVIRRIFTDYVAGRSPRAIAVALNDAGMAPPHTGRGWRAQNILGNRKSGSGVLRNETYIGVLRWGRKRNIRNPDTGRIVQRLAGEECVRVERPELAIVSRELWLATQTRLERLRQGPAAERRQPGYFLCGMLRCGGCGGALISAGQARHRMRIRCAEHAAGSRCPTPRTIYIHIVQDAVIQVLRAEMRHPAALADFVRTYHEERRRLAAEHGAARTELERRLAAARRELERIIDCIAKGYGDPAVLGPRATEMHRQRAAIEAELKGTPEPLNIVALHPAALTRYEERLTDLAAALSTGNPELNTPLRELIDHVTVHRAPGRNGEIRIEITGRLNALLGEGAYPDRVCGSAHLTDQIRLSTHSTPIVFRITVAA